MAGLERGTVELESHRAEWESEYETETERLCGLLGDHVHEFEHVGSTAVDGLPAKPIIDVLGVVESLETARELVPILEEHGYEYRPKDGVDDRVFLAKGPRIARTHYLSLTTPDSATYREQLAFRDYLRADPDVANEYGDLKHELAAQYPDDRASYTAEKSDFIESILGDALDK